MPRISLGALFGAVAVACLATGGVADTVATADAAALSVTVSENVRTTSPPVWGATKDALALPAPDKLTDGPAVCAHWYDSGPPSGSADADPSIADRHD